MYSLLNSNLVDKIFSGLNEPSWQTSTYTYGDKSYFQRTTEYGVEFEMFVPGLSKKDVKVELEDNRLFIEAKYSSDLTSYEVSKTFTIGEHIDTDNIDASVENGVLKLILPFKKKEEKKKSRVNLL